MTEYETESAAFIEEQRDWLKLHREQTGLSWGQLSKRINIAASSLSLFGGKEYNGPETRFAEAIVRYRNALAAQSAAFVDAPVVPEFFETQTSEEISNLLLWCRMGKMVYCSLGSGLGKTTSIDRFATATPNVIVTTLLESQGGQGPFQQAVLAAMGEENAAGNASGLSLRIIQNLKKRHKPVLIIDEAQFMSVKTLEEVRGISDATGAGVALFGDKRLSDLINLGTGKNDLPQLRRRIRSMKTRVVPYNKDVEALAAAWKITNAQMISELKNLVKLGGGLGRATQILEDAAMLASGDKRPMELGHLKEAIAENNRRTVSA